MGAKSIEIAEPVSEQWFTTGVAVGAVMLLGLLFGMFQIFIVGHKTLASSNDVPWNIFVVIYAFCISAIGLSYIASFGIVLGFKQFDIIARRAIFLSLVVVAAGMTSIMLDLGNPLKGPYIFFNVNPRSAIGVAAITLTTYMFLGLTELYLLIKRGHHDRLVKIVATAAFLVAIVLHSNTGAIFGMIATKDLWGGPFYPLYFVLSAIYISSAIIILVTVVTYRATRKQISARLEETICTLRKLLVISLGVAMLFHFWKIYYGYYAGKGVELDILTTGSYRLNFWIGEILIGFIIPFTMLLLWKGAKNFNRIAIAALLVIIGGFIGRYDFIIIGQLIPNSAKLLSGLGVSDYLVVLSTYSPNITEIVTAVGLLGMVGVAYILGVKYLALDEDER